MMTATKAAAPNFMVFSCSLDRIEKAAAKSKDAGRIERTRALRADAVAAYKAKDYGKAVELHNAAHDAASGEGAATVAPATADEAVVVGPVGSPRPPKATKPKKAAAPKAAKPAAPKPAAKQPAKTAKGAKAKPASKLSAMGAAHAVLSASKEPMNVKAIIEQMAKQGLWTSPGGKTPHSTLAAALMRDIAAKGRESRFKKVDRGLFAASGR
jgi:hypothetical protein